MSRAPSALVVGVLGAVLGSLLLAGCSGGPIDVAGPTPTSATDVDACRKFLAALPASVAGEKAREVNGGQAAAFGDPPIVVTCGASAPAGFSADDRCDVVDDIGWYVPDEVYKDQEATATVVGVDYRPVVQVSVPGAYRPDGVAAALVDVAGAVRDTLTRTSRCGTALK